METVKQNTDPNYFAAKIFVEILDSHDRVSHRVHVDQDHFTLGRGFDNDVILDDEYVSAEHLKVELTGSQFLVRDLNSTNGFFLNRKHLHGTEKEIAPNQKIKVGQTRVRFRHNKEVLDETTRDRYARGDRFWSSDHKGFIFCALLVMLGLTALDIFFETPSKVTEARVIGETLTGILIVAVWAGIWSLFTKLMTDRLSFFQHAGIFIVANIVVMLLTHLVSFVFYAMNWDNFMINTLVVLIAVTLAWLIYRHLGVSTHMSHRPRVLIALFITGLGLAIYTLDEQVLSDEFDPSPQYDLLVKSPELNLREGVSLESFFNKSRELAEDNFFDQEDE